MADRRPEGQGAGSNGRTADQRIAPERPENESKSIDADQVAERVYRLMLAEVRLERARRGHG